MALALGVAALAACGWGTPPAESEGGAPAAREAAPAVELVTSTRAHRGDIRTRITTSGSIVARRETPIGPAVGGRILHIFVEVGDDVVFGAPLFQVDPEPYALALQDAEAGLALARAELESAREEEARARKLAAKQMTSEQTYRRARTRAAVAAAHLDQAKARVASVRADLRRTLALAPYAGSIVERSADEGIMATVRPNTRILVLQESGKLEAQLDVPEASPLPVRRGDAVRLYVQGSPEPLQAKVRSVNRKIDPRTRTYRIRVPIENPDGSIKAGAFVRAEVDPSPRVGALLVDRASVVRRDGAAMVFRVKDGIAERVPVQIGVEGPREVEILGGLQPDDEVVVGDVVSRLMDGARIRVAKVADVAAAAVPASGDPKTDGATP
ncbi:MAG: efflux RND transporter periplasmic adaptor subunit [Myxococcota bacterium]